MQPWLIAIIVVAAIICFLFAFSWLAYKIAFGSRSNKNPLLKYFAAEDFGLTADKVTTKDGKVTLNGYIYTKKDIPARNGLVIFQHGMGPGQAAYTTEIAYFCKQGYTVLAFDIRGCELSEGANSKGMYSGVACVNAAVDYAKNSEKLKDKSIYLVGHSWGGYSVLCAAAERKVDKVVAISAPLTPVKTLYKGAANLIGKPLAFLLCPFWYLLNFLKFGKKGNANAAKRIVKSGIPTMLVHGDNDSIVPFDNSAYAKAKGGNIQYYLAKDKSHNPYNSVAAQKLIIELNENLSSKQKVNANKSYFENFDFKAATEEDETVMQAVCRFLE